MDPTVTVICAAVLIWIGLGRPAASSEVRKPSAPRPEQRQARALLPVVAARAGARALTIAASTLCG